MDLKEPDIRETQKEDEEDEEEQSHQEQHFHVLAVDDSIIDRKLLERLLTVSSYQVTCVDSGNKALEYLGLLEENDIINIHDSEISSPTPSASYPHESSSSSRPPQQEGSKVNLIITDYSMPGMSGYDLLRRVKGSSWKDIPVVVMSSENVPARINMCLEGGAEEFLLKPVQLSDLKKLQSHLVKPLSHLCKDFDMNLIDDDEIYDDDDDNKNDNNNDNNNNSNINKRKAMSPDCSKRMPKMKELSVV